MRTTFAVALTLFLKWLLRADFDNGATFFMVIGFALCFAADLYELGFLIKRLR